MTGFQKRTPRGFGYSEFASTHREYPGPLEVQESSVATQRCLWIGSGEARAHLDEDRVRELLDLLTWWFGEDKEGDDDERSCSRCGDAVQILNSQDECMGCEEERATISALEREGRESVRKGTALAAALAELDRDGYVHVAAGGMFRPSGIRSDKRLYSKRTIDALGEFIRLDYTGYCTYGRMS